MRRKISLYIADHLADLADESFILFNYTMEDMSNPTIVRNSYSQQITLKGTPNNNRIFGHIWKSDRETEYGASQAGIYFDPTQKTPFAIYNEMNEILESGYCKLDEIIRKSGRVEYKVSLFGGLGAFLFALSYDDQGNRRTLADLKYRGAAATDSELDFVITKDAVFEAWARLNGRTDVPALWDILNFAPAYNGLPGGTFDADKALVNVANAGIPVPDGHTASSGWVLASLPKKYTEWETKDLRSYLQRGVIKMSAIIQAICQSYNNGGYTVNLDSDFFEPSNPYYSKTWLTLPTINTLNIDIDEGGGNITPNLGDFVIPEGGDMSLNYVVNLGIKPALTIQDPTASYYNMHFLGTGNQRLEVYCNYIVYTLRAYDSNDNLLQTSVVRASTFQANLRIPDAPYIDYVGTALDSNGVWVGDASRGTDLVRLSVEARGISYINLTRAVVALAGEYATETPNPNMVWYSGGAYNYNKTVTAYGETFPQGGSDSGYYSSDSVRSGVTITKRMLLSGDRTPADYLLSYCKMFGLVFHYDKPTKTVSILTRQNFYRDTVVDLTERINQGQGINMQPFAFDAKWYNFSLPYDNGEYAKYYNNLYDSIFGIQRVNTGYSFNADQRDLLEGIAFRGACEVLENSKYYVDIRDGSKYIPAIFQDGGGKYGLLDGTGATEDFDLPTPSARAVKTWWNDTNKTFDFLSKVQFHDAENAGYEERDTLLFFNGIEQISSITDRIAVTDDTSVMLTLNDNTPCWILDYQLVSPSSAVTYLPRFSRYMWDDDEVTDSLDFGTPAEVAIPDVTFADDSSIYEQFWQTYIRDRYDDDSRVMVCRVNLAGWQVNEDLFRQFYWYEGSVWALNRIINHSLSTWDDTECEFIKVQDKDNYLI